MLLLLILVAKIGKVNVICKKKDPKFCETNSFSYFCGVIKLIVLWMHHYKQ